MYQDIVIEYLKTYAANSRPANIPDVKAHVIVDRETNHFQFLRLGWQGSRFVFAVIFHFEIREGKIWIHRNNTEREVVDVFLEKGVASEDIVLGFHPPDARRFTGLGVA